MALALNQNFEPRHGEAVEIAPGVRRVTAPNTGPLTLFGTNSYLVGRERLAVIDPGPNDPAHVEALMRAIGETSVAHILVTHSHHDHVGAAPRLKALTGAPILAALRRPPGASPTFVPDKTLIDGAVVEGDFRFEVVATPGHASDHVAFALPASDLLFSGDHVMGWSTTMVAPPDGSMRDYMASLDRLIERPEGVYLPGHGPEIGNPHAHMRALKSHRKMRERAILDGLAGGDRTVEKLVARIYRDLAPRLQRAAALSTLAHLTDLVERGLVGADGSPTLASTYHLIDATPSVPASGSG